MDGELSGCCGFDLCSACRPSSSDCCDNIACYSSVRHPSGAAAGVVGGSPSGAALLLLLLTSTCCPGLSELTHHAHQLAHLPLYFRDTRFQCLESPRITAVVAHSRIKASFLKGRTSVFVVLSSRRSLSSAVQRRVLLNDFITGRFK